MPIVSLFSKNNQHRHDFKHIIMKHAELLDVMFVSDEETLYTVNNIDHGLESRLTNYLVQHGSESTNYLIRH
jgi:hypothetical protein